MERNFICLSLEISGTEISGLMKKLNGTDGNGDAFYYNWDSSSFTF